MPLRSTRPLPLGAGMAPHLPPRSRVEPDVEVSLSGGQDGARRPDPSALPRPLLGADGLGPDEPSLPPAVAAHLGERLRAYYAGALAEPVPDRLSQLLGQLDARPHDEDA